MTKERAILEAQRDANRTGDTVAVLNLNTIGAALYVIRKYKPEYESDHQFVAKVYPSTVDQGG